MAAIDFSTDKFIGGSFMTTFKSNLINWVKSFVNSKITGEISKLGNIMTITGKVASKEALPTDAKPGAVYMVGADDDVDSAEYVRTASGTWEYLGVAGGTEVDMSGYTSNKVLFAGDAGTGTTDAPAEGTILGAYNKRIKDLEDTIASITLATNTDTDATFPEVGTGE